MSDESTDRGPNGGLAVIIVAAGSSTRMGGVDKVWADLAGEPVLRRTVAQSVVHASQLIVVTRAEDVSRVERMLAGLTVHACCSVVAGGLRRQDSVQNGLAAVACCEWTAVHDGARPLASAALFKSVWDAARETGGAIPVVPITDTVKRTSELLIESTVDRSDMSLAQTPQIFRTALLRRAYAEGAANDVTDDASLMEHLGVSVAVVPGEHRNLKITDPDDLVVATAFLGVDSPMTADRQA